MTASSLKHEAVQSPQMRHVGRSPDMVFFNAILFEK
jgi:hypothetical protein